MQKLYLKPDKCNEITRTNTNKPRKLPPVMSFKPKSQRMQHMKKTIEIMLRAKFWTTCSMSIKTYQIAAAQLKTRTSLSPGPPPPQRKQAAKASAGSIQNSDKTIQNFCCISACKVAQRELMCQLSTFNRNRHKHVNNRQTAGMFKDPFSTEAF